MGHINSNTPEYFNRFGEGGTTKLKEYIVANKTVGGISDGNIISENTTFAQFVNAILNEADAATVEFHGLNAEGVVDDTVFSHVPLDEETGKPGSIKVKVSATPGRDDIEFIEVQKIVTSTIPGSTTPVTKKSSVKRISGKQASAEPELPATTNDFTFDVSFTEDDVAATSVELRVLTYTIVTTDDSKKPEVLPDEKPSGGCPEAITTKNIAFGEGSVSKATITASPSTPQSAEIGAADVSFTLTATATVGDDTGACTTIKIVDEAETVVATASAATVTGDITIAVPATGGVTSTKTYKAVATFESIEEGGDPVIKTSAPVTCSVTAVEPGPTPPPATVSVSATVTPTSYTDVPPGETRTYTIKYKLVVPTGATYDYDKMKVLRKITAEGSTTYEVVTDNLPIVTEEASQTVTLTAGTDPGIQLTETFFVAAYKSGSTEEVISDPCMVTIKTAEAELKVYYGLCALPYTACKSYTEGGELIDYADFLAWPTQTAKDVDKDWPGDGNIASMPDAFDVGGIGGMDGAGRKYDTHHWDYENNVMVEGSAWSTYPEIYTTLLPTRSAAESVKNDIFTKRRPFMYWNKAVALDSAEATAMTSASGYTYVINWPADPELAEFWCNETDYTEDPSTPGPGTHYEQWNLAFATAWICAFPKSKYTFNSIIEAGNVVTYKTGDITINGEVYQWILYDAFTPTMASTITLKLTAK